MDALTKSLYSKPPQSTWTSESAITEKVCRAMFFMSGIDAHSLAMAVGAPSESIVSVTAFDAVPQTIEVEVDCTDPAMGMTRNFVREPEGVYVDHQFCQVNDQRKGIGSRILGRSIDGYR